MTEENFDNYHSLKLIEALTSLIEKKPITRGVVEYLKHTLRFIPWSMEISDAWIELLKLMNAHLNQIEDFNTHQDELDSYVEKFDSYYQKFEILDLIINNAFQLNQFDSALEHVNNQIQIAQDENEPTLKNRAYHTKGVLYHVIDQLDDAKEWYMKAYKQIDSINNYKLEDNTLYSIANLYQHYLSDFDKSFTYYSKGYELASQTENVERESFYLDHMAMAQYEMQDYQKAIEYHNKAWQLLKDQPRSVNVLFHKVQFSMALSKLDQFERVGEELASILDLKKTNTDAYSNTWFLLLLSQYIAKKPENFQNLVSEFEEQLGLPMDPITLVREARKIATRTNHIPSIVNTNIYLAKYEMKDKPEEAISLLSEAKSLAEQNNRYREIANIKDMASSIKLEYESL